MFSVLHELGQATPQDIFSVVNRDSLLFLSHGFSVAQVMHGSEHELSNNYRQDLTSKEKQTDLTPHL